MITRIKTSLRKKIENKSDKNDKKLNNKNSNFIITFKNSKNTDKLSISKNCNYCNSSYHNINRCKLKNSIEQLEK